MVTSLGASHLSTRTKRKSWCMRTSRNWTIFPQNVSTLLLHTEATPESSWRILRKSRIVLLLVNKVTQAGYGTTVDAYVCGQISFDQLSTGSQIHLPLKPNHVRALVNIKFLTVSSHFVHVSTPFQAHASNVATFPVRNSVRRVCYSIGSTKANLGVISYSLLMKIKPPAMRRR